MSLARRGVLVGAMLLAGAVLSGCGPNFTTVDFFVTTQPPLAADVTYTQIRVPIGLAVGVVARPLDDGGEEIDEVFQLSSNDGTILAVAESLETKRFVFFGQQEGETQVVVHLDGEEVGSIPAAVISQAEAEPDEEDSE